MLKYIVLFAILAFIAGCSTIDKDIGSWVDSTKTELISAWGVPDAEAKLENGAQVLTYRRQWGSFNQYGGIQRCCTVTFTVSPEGKVYRWHYSNCPIYDYYPRYGK